MPPAGDASDPRPEDVQRITLLRPVDRPLVLFDAEIAQAEAGLLRAIPGDLSPLAVRLLPTRDCQSIRSRLGAAGLPTQVLDAGAVLDEGWGYDLADAQNPVRLARVAMRLRAMGCGIAAIVHRGPLAPAIGGLAAVLPEDLSRHPWAEADPAPVRAHPLDATGARPIPDNRGEVELDNALARRWLLGAIDDSRHSLHVQVYMVADDDIGRQVEGALARAAARGVAVRVLVDSLHGLHGSLGARNPLLERLAACPGVDLRLRQPIDGAPTLRDLKQRNHRKLVVADGRLALVGGRNLSHEYYTGFDEIGLTATSTWRLVRWLDAGARIGGPAVAEVQRLFRDAWRHAGGDDFPVETPEPAGDTPLRVVAHTGLRDAHTLETYLALIDGARERIDVVNGFPLLLELQHALLRALGRGMQVRLLFGHLTPTHAGGPFAGPWSSARVAATELVHSRMDDLIAAGAEGYLFCVPQQAAWSPDLGAVSSHVHAKLLCVDGRRCTVGSANLDITASYWEDELSSWWRIRPRAGPWRRASTNCWPTRSASATTIHSGVRGPPSATGCGTGQARCRSEAPRRKRTVILPAVHGKAPPASPSCRGRNGRTGACAHSAAGRPGPPAR